MKKTLITGANGFIGSFLAEEAKKTGMEVYAALRKSSDTRWIDPLNIHYVYPPLHDETVLTDFFIKQAKNGVRFDYVVHNAGATKASSKKEYFTTNTALTKNLVHALERSNCQPKKFILMSSLAACGPGNQQEMNPIGIADQGEPLTSYAASKLKAEQFLHANKKLPWIIIKPTTVYGPREKDLFVFVKMINNGLEAYIGLRKQHLSFIYVSDLAKAVILALQSTEVHKKYLISDGLSYTNHQLGSIIRENLNKKTLRLRVPIAMAGIAAFLSEQSGRLSGKYPIFNFEKLNELKSLNWTCDSAPAFEELGFEPEYDLQSGMKATIDWYREHKWI